MLIDFGWAGEAARQDTRSLVAMGFMSLECQGPLTRGVIVSFTNCCNP